MNKKARILIHPVMLLVLFLIGCSAREAGPTATPKPSFGNSFNVILAESGGQYETDGYSSFVNSQSGWASPGAVLVIGIKEGTTLAGKKFNYGDIVVIEGDGKKPIFRLATPEDVTVLTQEVTVFGKAYNGVFTVPKTGNLIA